MTEGKKFDRLPLHNSIFAKFCALPLFFLGFFEILYQIVMLLADP